MRKGDRVLRIHSRSSMGIFDKKFSLKYQPSRYLSKMQLYTYASLRALYHSFNLELHKPAKQILHAGQRKLPSL